MIRVRAGQVRKKLIFGIHVLEYVIFMGFTFHLTSLDSDRWIQCEG